MSSLPSERLGTTFFGDSYCTNASVGYSLDDELFGKLIKNRAANVVLKGLAGSLVINAIAAGLAGISAIFALLAYFCSNRVMEVVSSLDVEHCGRKSDDKLTFVTLLLAASLACLVWFLDLALVLVARNRIKDASNGALVGHIGNAVWMGLAAAVSTRIYQYWAV